MAEDGVEEVKTQNHRGGVCSTGDFGQPGLKHCKLCGYLCQQCYDDHSKSRLTKSHQVITASEGEAFTKSKVTPYPPCHHHNHRVGMDLHCLKCNIPICTTCSHGIHRGHDCCELDKQDEVCKTKLHQISEDTDSLIKTDKQAIDKTRNQGMKAEADLVNTAGSMAPDKQVEVTGYVISDKQVEVKEVSRIRLHAQGRRGVWGLVVHHQCLYVVHGIGLIVYCYTPDGSLSHKYEHEGGAGVIVRGMCLMLDGDTAMLVVSDYMNKALVWIRIIKDVTLMHDHTNQLNYYPGGLYNNRGDLMACDPNNNNIHLYTRDGKMLAVIKLPDDVIPWWVTRHGDGDQYVVSDHNNDQVVMIDNKGQVKTRYKGNINGVKVDGLHDVITDLHAGVLIANSWRNQVLLLRRTGDVVKILDQHVISPRTLYLDTDYQRLYVSGKDQHNIYHVFICEYITLLKCVKVKL